MFLRQIFHDGILILMCAASVMAALFVRVGIPEIEKAIRLFYNKPSILSDYYLLFDLVLALVTPYMLCFASAMTILTECDENIAGYLCATPVGKKGYIISRLIIPAAISFVASVIIMRLCALTDWRARELALVCAFTSALSAGASALIVAFSRNRVEGMAMGKMTGIVMLGLPAPFFLPSYYQYLFSPLPSFWIAKFVIEPRAWSLAAAIITLFAWSALAFKKFTEKIT
jgi:fluoroquinolone transport system permease protein